tara:strand:+ start:270 stop:1103 length:834 start_codon:yes stop_codon:yes gene_type:complete
MKRINKKTINESENEIYTDSDDYAEDEIKSYESDCSGVESPIKEIMDKKIDKKTKPANATRSRDKLIKTDEVEVLVKRGRKAKKKPIIVYLSESEEEEPKIIVKQKRGRKPKKNVIKYVDDEGNEHDNRNSANKTVISHVKEEKLTKKDLRLIELEEKLQTLEAVSGKKILVTKRGQVDKRTSIKQPSEKQLAARKLFVENNKKRHLEKKLKKEEANKQKTKDNVKVVVDEMVETKKKNLLEKQKIMEELKKEKTAELDKEKIIQKEKINIIDKLFD